SVLFSGDCSAIVLLRLLIYLYEGNISEYNEKKTPGKEEKSDEKYPEPLSCADCGHYRQFCPWKSIYLDRLPALRKGGVRSYHGCLQPALHHYHRHFRRGQHAGRLPPAQSGSQEDHLPWQLCHVCRLFPGGHGSPLHAL